MGDTQPVPEIPPAPATTRLVWPSGIADDGDAVPVSTGNMVAGVPVPPRRARGSFQLLVVLALSLLVGAIGLAVVGSPLKSSATMRDGAAGIPTSSGAAGAPEPPPPGPPVCPQGTFTGPIPDGWYEDGGRNGGRMQYIEHPTGLAVPHVIP
jgi:hypothetical protein